MLSQWQADATGFSDSTYFICGFSTFWNQFQSFSENMHRQYTCISFRNEHPDIEIATPEEV